MYNVLYIQKTHHDLFLSGPILHRKCSVRNKMFGFALALNLNLHSGSCLVVLLNLTPNIMFGSGSNIVRNVRNRTVASLTSEAQKFFFTQVRRFADEASLNRKQKFNWDLCARMESNCKWNGEILHHSRSSIRLCKVLGESDKHLCIGGADCWPTF